MNRRIAVNLVAFSAVFVLMLWWAANNIISVDLIERPYRIQGEFENAAGLSTGSEVTYLGVHYGTVDRVTLREPSVQVTMDIERGKRIPAGSTAHVQRKSAVGEPFIDLRPPEGGPSDRWIEAGDLIPQERTTVPIEFSEVLRSASRVISSVDPERTGTLVHELAAALDGRSDSLRGLVVDTDAVLGTFAERTELLDSLTDRSTQLVGTLENHRDAISSSVTDLAALAESLRVVQPETDALLQQGSELLGLSADLVGDVDGRLDCILSASDRLLEVAGAEENLDNVATLLDEGPAGLGNLWRARDDGPGGLWIRVALLVNFSNPALQYEGPRSLPAVPPVLACDSPMLSDASASRPGAEAGRPGVAATSGSTEERAGGQDDPGVAPGADGDGRPAAEPGEGNDRAASLAGSAHADDAAAAGAGVPFALVALAATAALAGAVLIVRRVRRAAR